MSNTEQLSQLLEALATKQPLDDRFKGGNFDGLKAPEGSTFVGAFLRYARFANSDLRNADFSHANLRHVDFRGADLRGAKFAQANVGKANFAGANVSGCTLVDAKGLGDVLGVTKTQLFFAQNVLEDIITSCPPGYEFKGQELVVPRFGTYNLEEAARAIEIIDGDDRSWLGRVLTKVEWQETADEYYQDVVEIDGTALSLAPGFIGTRPSSDVEIKTPAESAAQVGKRANEDDMTMLQDFLLGQLD